MPLTDESNNQDRDNPPQDIDPDDSEGAGETPAFFREFSADFNKFKEEVAGKFTQVGKDFGKMRSRQDRPRGSDSPDPKASDKGGNGAPASDSGAIFRLGRLMGSLPESVQEDLEEMITGGVSVDRVLDRAQFAKKHKLGTAASADGDGANPPKKTPPGQAATAPATTGKTHPSWTEWLQMNKDANAGDKKAVRRLRELADDASFVPSPEN